MAEKDTFKGIEFPEGLAPHQIEAIKNGGSAPNPDGTGAVTLESLGFDKATLTATAVDASAEVSRLRKKVEELEAQLADAQKAPAAATAKATTAKGGKKGTAKAEPEATTPADPVIPADDTPKDGE